MKHQDRGIGKERSFARVCELMMIEDEVLKWRFKHGSREALARLWVSVETGYPVQFEGERVYGDQRHTYAQDQFQWDVEIDESLFEPNIPEGYIVATNSRKHFFFIPQRVLRLCYK